MIVPVNQPLIAKNSLNYIKECVRSGWISSQGKFIASFEESFAKFLQVKFATTTTNGTSALHLALASLNIGSGDEVIVPNLTIISCPLAVLYTGAKPVLVEVEEQTGNIDVSKIESKITKKTKAIMVVHLYGHPANLDPILKIAKKHKIFVVEDAAQAHGATYKGKKVGSIGDVGCFSFYANKIITTGEGGMLTTNNEKIFKRAVLLKDLAHSPKKRFFHHHIGFNFRMTNIQAALGLAQLEQVDKYTEKKRWMADLYNELLKDHENLELPIEQDFVKSVYWMYAVKLKGKIKRDLLRKKLLDFGIDTRTFFFPLHRQPVLKRKIPLNDEKFPVSDDLAARGFYLPSGLAITKPQIYFVAKTIKKILNGI